MTIKQIEQTLEEGKSMKELAVAFGEIAALKIKKIRANVERNRQFFSEMSNLYGLVKKIATAKGITLSKSKGTISLILTSNYRFYGTINSELIKFYEINTAKAQTDRIVIGKSAVDHFKSIKYFHRYTPLVFKNDMPSGEELNYLVSLTGGYKQVLVFYSQLKSLLIQIPIVKDITLSDTLTTPVFKNEQDKKMQQAFLDRRFIFEPEVAKILQFFDSQLTTLLLEQTFLESELARTASRLISMDQAQVEANNFIKEYNQLMAYTKRSLDNVRILESVAAVRKHKYSKLHG